MAGITLVAPHGYRAAEPLHREKHGAMGVAAANYQWCADINAIPLGAGELISASAHYPIAFTRDDETGEFMPVAVLGLRRAENLFVDTQGAWQANHYVPAAARCFPFCIATIPATDGRAPQRLVCVEPSGLSAEGERLFNADGSATALWQSTQQFLETVEAAKLKARVLCKRLDALGLLTPFEALALPRDGQRIRLHGLFRVDEEKLNAVPGKDLRVMLRKGELKAIYAHLLSLEQFATLLRLATGRQARAGKP